MDVDRAALEAKAREVLSSTLGAAPSLRFAALFDERPLAGEGITALYSFDLPVPARGSAAAPATAPHYVAVGETEPGCFPAHGLTPDDAYSLHVGTRFLLGMNVQHVGAEQEPPGARPAAVELARRCAPGAEIGPAELACLVRCDEQLFAVYRLTIAAEPVYCLGADCPPGFYRLADRPPQVVLRLHLGKLIRQEAEQERRTRFRKR